MNVTRILWGLLVAPPAGLLLFALGDRVLNPTHIDSPLFATALFFTYAVTLVLGVPTMLLFRHLGLRKWWQFAIAGASLGVIAMLAIQYDPNASSVPHMEISQFVACASLGAACALIFWGMAVYVRGRIDSSNITSSQ